MTVSGLLIAAGYTLHYYYTRHTLLATMGIILIVRQHLLRYFRG